MNNNAEIKVLMFGWEFPPYITGGLGTACYGLTKALRQQGNVRTNLVLPKRQGEHDDRYVTIHYPSEYADDEHSVETSAYWGGLLPAASAFADRIPGMLNKTLTPDIIHAHDWLTAPAALAAKRILKKPLVFHVHSTEFDRCASTPDEMILHIEAQAMAQADIVVAVSDRTRRQLITKYHVDPTRIQVVYNGIEMLANDRQGSLRGDSPLICFLGRVTYQKGPGYFLQAAAKALEFNTSLRFVMAGDGDLLPAMRKLASKLGIAERVDFTGFLSADEATYMLRYASVLVVPSIAEPFGIVALEAAAAGAPVIISERAGVTEVLSQMLLVRPDDVEGIASAMLAVTSNDVLANRLRTGARDELRAISWDVAAFKLQSIYKCLSSTAMDPMPPNRIKLTFHC